MSLLDCYLNHFTLDEDELSSHLASCNDSVCSFIWWRKTSPIIEEDPLPPVVTGSKTFYRYLITFTRSPEVTKAYWFSRLISSLNRKFVASFECALEHVDSNIHSHAYILSNKYLRKRDFSKFPGHIKIDKVLNDNGVKAYISKENKIFTNTIELQDFFNSSLDGSPSHAS